MNKIKVLHIFPTFLVGGAEILIKNIILNTKKSEKIKQDLYIIKNLFEHHLVKDISENIFFANEKNKFNLISIFKFTRYVLKNKYDIIHIHIPVTIFFVLFIKILMPNIKVIYTIHNTNTDRFAKKFELNFLYRFVDKYIAISECVMKDALRIGFPMDRITLIYNSIDISKYDAFEYKKEVNKQYIVFACIGRLYVEQKGQDILINALNILKNEYKCENFKCYFAGDTNSSDYDSLKKLKESYNLNDNIEFLGMVQDIPTLLKHVDVLVIPSRYEGFGLVVLEGIAGRCHIVSSKIDGPKEILQDIKSKTEFEVEDYFELAYILKEIYINGVNFMECDYIKIRERYSVENMCALYTQEYYSLIKE